MHCNIVSGPFCWKCVKVKSHTYTCMHSAISGVRVLVTRTPEYAHWLVYFCWGLLIVAAEKGKTTEISHSEARSLVTYFWGFKLWQQRTCCYVRIWYKRERTSKHSAIWDILGGSPPRINQIASCFDALSTIQYSFSRVYNTCANFYLIDVNMSYFCEDTWRYQVMTYLLN
jgi:hypothetical protein